MATGGIHPLGTRFRVGNCQHPPPRDSIPGWQLAASTPKAEVLDGFPRFSAVSLSGRHRRSQLSHRHVAAAEKKSDLLAGQAIADLKGRRQGRGAGAFGQRVGLLEEHHDGVADLVLADQ